jgi:DNA-binding NarL/FixJ family response regulator
MTVHERPVRLALLNDHPVVVAGLSAVLGASGTAFDLRQVTTTLADLDQDLDLVLFDSFGAPGVARRVAGVLACTRAAVLLFSASVPPAGLLGPRVRYLSKGASADELVAGILAAAHGRDPLVVLDSSRTPGSWPGQADGLTMRESEVLALIAAGLTNADVAATLFLGLNTVKTHVRTGYAKMGVRSRSTAVLWALEHGFGADDA